MTDSKRSGSSSLRSKLRGIKPAVIESRRARSAKSRRQLGNRTRRAISMIRYTETTFGFCRVGSSKCLYKELFYEVLDGTRYYWLSRRPSQEIRIAGFKRRIVRGNPPRTVVVERVRGRDNVGDVPRRRFI
jgi:hypothetical protein